LKVWRLAKTKTGKANKKAGYREFFQKKDFIKYKKFLEPRLIYGQFITPKSLIDSTYLMVRSSLILVLKYFF